MKKFEPGDRVRRLGTKLELVVEHVDAESVTCADPFTDRQFVFTKDQAVWLEHIRD